MKHSTSRAAAALFGALLGAAVFATRAEPIAEPAWTRTLDGLNREAASLSALSGEMTLVHFWADWCGPCKRELPELEAFYRTEYPALRERGVRLVTVSNDYSVKAAREVIARYDLTVPVFFDPKQRLTRSLGKTRALPLTVVIGPDRHVKLVNLGPMDWSAAAIERALGGLAAAGGS